MKSHMPDNADPHFGELLLRLFDENVSDCEFQSLHDMITTDPNRLEQYIQAALVRAAFNHPVRLFGDTQDTVITDMDSEFWRTMAEGERITPPADLAEPGPVFEPVTGVRERRKLVKSHYQRPRLFLYITFTGMAALLLMVAYVVMNPRFVPDPVAVLADTFQARWEDESIHAGMPLTNNKSPLRLVSGCAKLEFDSGAQVIIEGPAEFNLITPEQMRMSRGKLTAIVPPAASGFRVDTSSMSVIDLGTEFSVWALPDGGGEVHLFNGRASLLSGKLGTRQGSQILTQDQARSVAAAGNVQEIAISRDRFVRRFYSDQKLLWQGEAISLASLIAGGNGFDPVLDFRSLNPNTGQYNTARMISQDLKAVYGYHRVETNQFIDGVFVPNADKNPTVISSQGHVFNGPSTSEMFSFNIISFFQQYDMRMCNAQPPVFDDIQYNTQTQPTVLLHSNIGITIDLESVRQAYPGLAISKMITGYGSTWAENRSQVDFFVLVDGVIKHKHKQIRSRKASWPLELDLGSGNRFLTFIVTDSPEVNQAADLAHKYDFFYLLSPRLMMR